jgi:hypothetical protein
MLLMNFTYLLRVYAVKFFVHTDMMMDFVKNLVPSFPTNTIIMAVVAVVVIGVSVWFMKGKLFGKKEPMQNEIVTPPHNVRFDESDHSSQMHPDAHPEDVHANTAYTQHAEPEGVGQLDMHAMD